MQRFFPILQWLPGYKKDWIPKDLVAGLTVGIVLIPQGMAYAMMAGLPPVYGLYASLIPVLVYAFLGTSPQLSVGPVAMDSLLVAAGLGALAIASTEEYIAMAVLLAFFVGFIQVLLGIFRMGFLVNLMSGPVIGGFTSGAAIIIMLSQIGHLFGVGTVKSGQFHVLVLHLRENLGNINGFDVALGVFGMLLIVLARKWNKRIPGILIAVVLGILAVFFADLESRGVHVVGDIPHGLPHFEIPEFNVEAMLQLWPLALTLAFVGYLEAVSIGRALEEKSGKETLDADQELVALGSSNMLGSFFQSFPVAASFSRSAINGSSGGRTSLASVASVLLVVATLLFLTPLFRYLPNAILASIIIVSVFGLIDVAYARHLWRNRRDEFAVLLATFATTLFVGIMQGILLGVLLSLLLMVYRSSKPHFAVLGKIGNTDYYRNIDRFGYDITIRKDLLIVRFDSQLYFGNSAYFKKQLFKYIDAKGEGLKAIILNAEAIHYIDSSAGQMLVKVVREIHDRGLQFFMVGAIGPVRDVIFGSDIIKELHKEFLFVSIKDAVSYYDDPQSLSLLGSKVAYENRSHNGH